MIHGFNKQGLYLTYSNPVITLIYCTVRYLSPFGLLRALHLGPFVRNRGLVHRLGEETRMSHFGPVVLLLDEPLIRRHPGVQTANRGPHRGQRRRQRGHSRGHFLPRGRFVLPPDLALGLSAVE